MSGKRIIVVEDDRVVRTGLERALRANGYQVAGVSNSADAVNAVHEQKTDLMILDLGLVIDSSLNGIIDGFSLLHWLRYSLGEIDFPVIIYTSDYSPNVDRRAKESGIHSVLRKDCSLEQLLCAVRSALDDQQALSSQVAATES